MTATHTALTAFQNDLLDKIPSDGWTMRAMSDEASRWWPTSAPADVRAAEWTGARLGRESVVIVWNGELGVEFGVVRCARRFENGDEYFEASPFPGGWSTVRRDQIIAVRSTLAM